MVKLSFGNINSKGRKVQGSAGKLVASLVFLAFFGMGTFFEVMVVREFMKKIARRSWPSASCKIVASDVEHKASDEQAYVFVVSYEYQFNSQEFTSTVYKKDYEGSDEYHKAYKLVERYPAGREAVCYVNPENPGEAVLKRGSLLFGFVIFFPLIFVLVGASGLYAIWIWRDKHKGRPKPIAAKARRKRGKGLGIVFFGIFAAVGGGMFYPFSIRPVFKTISARSWVETPCKILAARVQRHEGDDSDTYSVDIFYEYEFEGTTYKSSRYGFVGGSSSGRSGKARVVNAYKKAKDPVCYVNPKNPSEAVLKRGLRPGLLICLIPVPFLLIGVFGLRRALRGKKRRLTPTTAEWMPQTAQTPDWPIPAPGAVESGPIVLKARYSPLVKLLGTIAFAAFWNGIVSVFVYQVVQGFRHGRPEWFLTVFMIPFVLVGIGAIGFVFRQVLALFNPRPTLKLSPGEIALGGAAELDWTFSGRTSAINSLEIKLVGREEATYRRGTKTKTDKRTFYELELVSSTQSSEIASGQVGLIIPQDTMHSFEAKNNKIIWELEVHGDIAKWPDVKERFKITVTPTKA